MVSIEQPNKNNNVLTIMNKKNILPLTESIKKPIVKRKSISPEQEKIIDENITLWEKENADRLSLEKEINSLSEGTKRLIKKLRKAEKTDPKKPILRASADDYDKEKDAAINYKENIGV